MNLKSATNLVIISLSIGLLISLIQWTLAMFGIFNWFVYRGFGLILMLLHWVPLIIFFSVLKSKQEGQ